MFSFRLDNPEVAYLLGLLLTDGYVGKKGKSGHVLTLNSIDEELIKKFSAYFGTKIHNQIKGGNRQRIYYSSYYNNELILDLFNYGMNYRKSHNDISCYPSIPNHLFKYFLNGCIDGDGSLWINKQNGSLSMKLSSSLKLIEGIRAQLSNITEIDFTNTKLLTDCRSKSSMVEFRSSGLKALLLCRYMYRNNEYGLLRKRDIFSKALADGSLSILDKYNALCWRYLDEL